MKRGLLIVAALLPALFAACASTPEASPDLDREAKQFVTHPEDSTLYVYRTDAATLEDDSVLWINGRLIGATLPRSYFRIHLNPGRQQLSGSGLDNGNLLLETRPGEAYFVRLQVVAGHSRFETVPADHARPELLACCGLLENWHPGQRPLLR
jgi:hypothetical protein